MSDTIHATAIGQDSHRFVSDAQWQKNPERRLVLAGVVFDQHHRPLAGNSDADVVLHALTNAISGLSGVNILGKRADFLCQEKNITDSGVYLREAIETLGDWQIRHASFCIEAKTPRLSSHLPRLKENVARLLDLSQRQVGMTATSGEGLTAFGRGEGMQVFCLLSACRPLDLDDAK